MGLYDPSGEYPNDVNLRAVHLSIEIEKFLNTKLGELIVAKAHTDSQNAIDELIETDPSDLNKIKELQFRAKLPKLVLDWLDEAFTYGQDIEKAITEAEKFENTNI